MTEAEFRAYAVAEGYSAPEAKSLPADRFFDTHTHDHDLIVLITAGEFTVGYGDDKTTFGPGEMCHVAPGIDHTDATGREGAEYLVARR